MINTNSVTLYTYTHTKLFRFVIVGATGTIWNLGLMYFLTDVVGFHYILSYVIAFSVALTNNYLLNSRWTFQQNPTVSGWLKYGFISLFTLGANEILLYILTGKLGLWYMASAMIGILTAFVINYFLSRKIVWK